MRLETVLFGAVQALRLTAWRFPEFRARLGEHNAIVQLKLADDSVGRYIEFRDGKILTRPVIHPAPDVVIFFKDRRIALKLLAPKQDFLFRIDAMKNFKMGMLGPDELTVWVNEIVSLGQSSWWKQGEDIGGGVTRFTNNTNGGPVQVYVKDGKILRITPIDFTDKDPDTWAIQARGQEFRPPRRATAAPYAIASKSMVYANNRNLYPMKRVDFDPHGERNPQNRGKSGYERISWDEALTIVTDEFKRVKKECGPGAIAVSHGSHHLWGNVGYYLSAMQRFFNNVGFTRVHHNPDSWEGWYWGAQHHWGHSMRLGIGEVTGQVEDILKECEMMVFWSSDPEATNGCYAAYEGTVRRLWAKQLGIKFVHIDPYWNHTAALLKGKWIAPRPGTDPALAQAISYVWLTEELYDKKFVAERTTGFEEWAEYLAGRKDGVPKTPEWAEAETGVAARDIRALAREWGKRKTYLAAGGYGNGFGGACRTATGAQWARMMVMMMAMQGIGKPGVNFGNMQTGVPHDYSFWFPGYAEGGISGDLNFTGAAVNSYQRIPLILSMNPVKQVVPRLQLPEAIMEGKAQGFFTEPSCKEGQFIPYFYPAPGYSPIQILYKYGGAQIGTMPDSNRWARMYRSENLPFVVSQSIWFEGEAQFADIILPACTNFERTDVSEWCSAGGYGHQFFTQLNHRMVIMQHKCIEPLGESKSDYQIFLELSKRLGLGPVFSEGMTELDWVKRIFEGSDAADLISWKEFLKKGYVVVPPEKEKLRAPRAYAWFNEGRKKDIPEPHPLPGDYSGEWLEGLGTQSGKFEFIPNSLLKVDDPDRPALNRYERSWEGANTTELLGRFPLQLMSAHSRYSFHSMGDGKGSALNDIEDHRLLVDGHYYWRARISVEDARSRGIAQNDLIRLFNDRGSVVCAAQITSRVRPGIVHSYESSAVYKPVGEAGTSTDIGGCVNILTSNRSQGARSTSMGPNATLIQMEKWNPAMAEAAE
ncbi:molybdopterin-dependent oxidoreductase [Sphingobium fluviale]|uniref:Pyrogallol hydroxytransferase large subunit n=1 Tax=Sphingobium fluviale TaxID=2506423 RepID=A0A4Q1KGC9_9SPHN|nr:molybdopterin-dependent oxidoreductase [Sphingobium fluviale]RXR28532.1 pyrogallol hydroxytransferase large subunit [Sphingobium fluviale]